MKMRVEKYNNDNGNYLPKRTKKNVDLYEDIKNSELENLSIGSNARVIGENDAHIDIDKIKELLEKNYQEQPKRRSLVVEEEEEYNEEIEKTREYDINAILEKAREEKEVDYQEERLKKIRDTQYDILKNLELDGKEKEGKAATEATKEELLELINTINLNEYQNKKEGDKEKELDPLDILTDLKGNEDTVVAGAKEFQEELVEKEKEYDTEVKEIINEKTNEIDKTFYTTDVSFTKDDFDDFSDLDKQGKLGSFIVKVLIIIIFAGIVAGLLLFLNDFLKLGWF